MSTNQIEQRADARSAMQRAMWISAAFIAL